MTNQLGPQTARTGPSAHRAPTTAPNSIGVGSHPSYGPAPVELGLGVHRDRLRAPRPGARRARARVALPRPVAQRPAAAHRLHRGRALLPGPRVLADRALARRAARAADVGHRPAADPRDRRLGGLPPRARPRARGGAFARELLPKLAAWHEYLYRERVRDGDGLVEVWHPWETGMDNSPLWDDAARTDRARAGRRARVPPRRRASRRRVPAADQRASTTGTRTSSASSASTATGRTRSASYAVRRPGGDLQRAPRAGEPRPRRDRARRRRRIRAPTRSGAERPRTR